MCETHEIKVDKQFINRRVVATHAVASIFTNGYSTYAGNSL